MAINLLPKEHKIKFKKQKSAAQTTNIEMEMTGAEWQDKNKPGIKKAGVLSFFKQVIERPKEDIIDTVEKQKSIQMPEKKVALNQKITYKNIFGSRRLNDKYHVMGDKHDSIKPVSDMKSDMSSVFDNDKKQGNKYIFSTSQVDYNKEHFPRYKSISAEKVLTPEHVKGKKTKIIEVSTADHMSDIDNISAWQRFKKWLSGLLMGSKAVKKEFRDPARISDLQGFPKPKDGQIKAIEEKEVINFKEAKNAVKPTLEDIEKKIGLPYMPKAKDKLISYATPLEVQEEIDIFNEEPPKPAKPLYQPKEITYDKVPAKIERIIANNFIDQRTNITTDKVIKEESRLAEKNGAKKNWLKKLLNWLNGIFSKVRIKKDTTKEVKEKIKDKPFIEDNSDSKFEKPIYSKLLEKIKFSKKQAKELAKPIHDEKINIIPPPKPPEISQAKKPAEDFSEAPKPPTPAEDHQDTAKLTEKMSQAIGFNGDQMNWEVNLIPEESKEKEIPISLILVMIMSVIISVGLVFGGWLLANYYYNTISVTISEVDAEIANIQSDIVLYENIQDDAKELQQKIENISLLLEKHIYWAEFFNKLEFYTISNVYYNNMSADVNGSITLTAVSDSYENAIKQLYVFKEANDFVTLVTISDISKQVSLEDSQSDNNSIDDQLSLPTEIVNFNVNLTINPDLFYYIN